MIYLEQRKNNEFVIWRHKILTFINGIMVLFSTGENLAKFLLNQGEKINFLQHEMFVVYVDHEANHLKSYIPYRNLWLFCYIKCGMAEDHNNILPIPFILFSIEYTCRDVSVTVHIKFAFVFDEMNRKKSTWLQLYPQKYQLFWIYLTEWCCWWL